MNTALYLRCSTDKQETSLAQQCAELEAWAIHNDLTVVVAYFDQGISGATSERPGLQSLLADAKAGRGGFEVVLVYDRSRWGRFADPFESVYWEMELKRAGVALRTMRESFEDNFAGAIMRLISDYNAYTEREAINTRMQRGRVYATKEGYWVQGRPPYGYRLKKVKDGKQTRTLLELGPDNEVQCVKAIFKLRKSAYSYRQIAERLNRMACPAPRGGFWTAEQVKRIHANPVYRGRIVYSSNKWGFEGEAVGECPAIVEGEGQ